MGGLSEGARQAGANVIQGIDSDPSAIRAFRANHPHALGTLSTVEAARIPGVGALDLLLASPPCQDFSRARGKRPVDTQRQSLPWTITTWVQQCRPLAFLVENVPGIQTWPDWKQWKQCLVKAGEGYNLYVDILDAVELGVPQSRKRLFVTGIQRARDAIRPDPWIRVPNTGPTPAWTVLDPPGTYPTQPLGAKAPQTQARAHHLYDRLGQPDTLILTYYSGGSGGYALDEPLRTLTTRDRFALVTELRSGEPQIRMLQPTEIARGMGWARQPRWPEGTTRAQRVQLLGNSVCPPVAKALVERITSCSFSAP